MRRAHGPQQVSRLVVQEGADVGHERHVGVLQAGQDRRGSCPYGIVNAEEVTHDLRQAVLQRKAIFLGGIGQESGIRHILARESWNGP